MQDGKSTHAQPFSAHIKELRQRMMYVIAVLIIGCTTGYFIHERLFSIIRRPLHQQLYYTTPTGGFNAVIKISILFGVVITIPILIHQIIKFVSPVAKRKPGTKRIITLSISLAAIGVVFAYYICLPSALHFLANVDSQNFQSIITINEYLNFVFAYIAGFALLFQLPLLLLFINRIKPLDPGSLMRIQRWVILISFILAAILTPTPDPMNQFLMALPIILLYQFSVMLIWGVNRRKKPVPQQPMQVVASEPDAGPPPPPAYSADTYSAPAPMPTPQFMPQLAMAETNHQEPPASVPIPQPGDRYLPIENTQPVVQAPLPKPKPPMRQPRLIMDIYWVPYKPVT